METQLHYWNWLEILKNQIGDNNLVAEFIIGKSFDCLPFGACIGPLQVEGEGGGD